jgi:hypothetical protein
MLEVRPAGNVKLALLGEPELTIGVLVGGVMIAPVTVEVAWTIPANMASFV